MKKIYYLILPVFMFILLSGLLKAPERVSGAADENASDIGIEQQIGIEQTGPPWYDFAWHYRRPLTISNTGAGLAYYQVLVKLDNANFDFSLAKADGADIRFTDSSGKTPLYYWIESWNNTSKLAYLWVLVSNIAPTPNNTTIYLYYGNPAATSSSNGAYTFDFFDDNWCQFPGANCSQSQVDQKPQSDNNIDYTEVINSVWMESNLWSVIHGTPTASNSILQLTAGTGIQSTSPFQYQAVGYKVRFGLGNGNEGGGFKSEDVGKGTVIGDLPSDPSNIYLMNFNPNEYSTLIPPVGVIDWHNAYHIYEVRWQNNQSRGDIDHGTSSVSSLSQVPGTTLPVAFYNVTGSTATLLVDWTYVRQYRNPEPTASVGAKQGLVDLAVAMSDAPDPINTNRNLTYEIIVSNISNIDAPSVVVTDTLPGSVQFISASADGGCNYAGSEVVCDMLDITANTAAHATIVVKATVGGTITNGAVAGTLGFDQDMSNNLTYTNTYVDTFPPSASWVLPTTNGQLFTTFGGTVTLEVTASDNDAVSYVEFWWYKPNTYNYISTTTTPPYQTVFNTNLLPIGTPYLFEVRVYDRAGNTNFPANRFVIYIQRFTKIYLPTVFK